MLHTASEIVGLKVCTVDGPAARVKDIYFDERTWCVRYLLLDTGLYFPGAEVLIEPEPFGIPDLSTGELPVDLTRREVKMALPRSADPPCNQRREMALAEVMGWTAPGEFRPMEAPISRAAAQEATPSMRRDVDIDEAPCHRSTRDLTGYHIYADDGEIGHVCDFLIDTAAWGICYLLADTRNWLPGRKVLLSPDWISYLSWADRRVRVELTREQVRLSPPYRLAGMVTRQYERRLQEHYRRPTDREAEL